MSHMKKAVLILAILCLIFLAANSVIRTWTFQQSFYPMGGEVTVIDKFETEVSASGKEIWKFDNGCVSYTYEFNEL